MSSIVPAPAPVWYDTREGFEKALKQGLGGLREIADARHKAGYDEKKRLKWWCVLGYFIFDTCGNTTVITEGRPTYDDFGKSVPRVFDKATFDENVKRSVTSTFGNVPPVVETCPRCLEGWTLRNVATYEAIREVGEETWTHYHKDCRGLMVLQNEIARFDEILAESEIPFTERRLVPACYPDRPTAPWFMVVTDKGTLKIGYRRSVYSISWEHAEGLKDIDGNVLFKDEGVTTDKTLVHAWGQVKVVEYLRQLYWADYDE